MAALVFPSSGGWAHAPNVAGMNAQELLASATRAGVEILPSGMIRMPVVTTEATGNALVWLHIHGDELIEKSFEVLALLQEQHQPEPIA